MLCRVVVVVFIINIRSDNKIMEKGEVNDIKHSLTIFCSKRSILYNNTHTQRTFVSKEIFQEVL